MRSFRLMKVPALAGTLFCGAAFGQAAVPPNTAAGAADIAGYGARDFPRLKSAIPLGEAVRRALSANANVVIQQLQIRAEEGNVQQSRGVYDAEGTAAIGRENAARPLRNTESAPLTAAGQQERAEYTNTTAYRAGVTKLLPSGAQLEAGVTFNALANTLTPPQQTTGNLRFALRIPLMRNAGGIQQSSALQARELERDASMEDLVQTSAITVVGVVQAYWELAGRIKRVEILKASEKRAEELAGEIGKLVAADQIPGAELDLAQASAAEKRAARQFEEQSFQAAWNALGRLLHNDTGDFPSDALSMDSLPAVDEHAFTLAEAALSRRTTAAERRADVRAARLRERSAYLQKAAAQDGVKPQVDLIASVGTNGLAEGSSALAVGPALGWGRPLPTAGIGVELRFPFENNAARGLVVTRTSAHDQSVVRMRDAERNVGPLVVTAAAALRRIALRYRDTLAAATRYETAVKNEYVKRRLGLSTLIDVINVQDRLDTSQLLLLQLRQEYAVAIAQLQFENGDLIGREPDGFRVDMPLLTGANPGKVAR